VTEMEAHELICGELNAGITSSQFFIWLSVTVEDPTPEADDLSVNDLNDLVRRTNDWLGRTGPVVELHDRTNVLICQYGSVTVSLRAGAWKPGGCWYHSAKVGPPSPVMDWPNHQRVSPR
jgi:hypothetical protein